MHKFFEYIIAILGCLRIVASPLIIGLGIGAMIYFPNPTVPRLVIACSVGFIGFIIGIIWAVRVWRRKGTSNFFSL